MKNKFIRFNVGFWLGVLLFYVFQAYVFKTEVNWPEIIFINLFISGVNLIIEEPFFRFLKKMTIKTLEGGNKDDEVKKP